MRHPSGREQQREAERVTIVIERVWRSSSLKGERDALENMKGERPTLEDMNQTLLVLVHSVSRLLTQL